MKNYSREKLLNSIVFFASKVKDLSITQLMKYLSNLDYMHFKETGSTITGLVYYTYPQGEYSKELDNEIKNQNTDLINYVEIKKTKKGNFDCTIFTPKKKFDKTYFSKRELRILDDLIYMFKGAGAKQMSLASHERSRPWKKTEKEKGMYKEIDFMLTIEDPDFKEFVRENKADSEKLKKVIC